MAGKRLIFGPSAFVIVGFVRLGLYAEHVCQVPPLFYCGLMLVFCQRYELCSTCGTRFDQSVGGASPLDAPL